MARTNNLTNFLTDVADSIRSKTGKTDQIPCEDFDTEIESISGGATLQTKSVTITENGTTNITPDTGYDGMRSVNVTTNVGDDEPFEYVQDGLIAWYEGEDEFDSNEHLNSRIGSDYLYVYSRTQGNATTNPVKTYNGDIVNQGTYGYTSSTDYYKTGYTIELVGYMTGSSASGTSGCWLLTGNVSQTAGIGTQERYKIMFQNDDRIQPTTPYRYVMNKPFSASLYLQDIGTSRGVSYKYITQGSVNGQGYVTETGQTFTHNQNSTGARTVFLAYYGNGYKTFGGIKSIRVYNRQLTNAEMLHNYNIDNQRFGLED